MESCQNNLYNDSSQEPQVARHSAPLAGGSACWRDNPQVPLRYTCGSLGLFRNLTIAALFVRYSNVRMRAALSTAVTTFFTSGEMPITPSGSTNSFPDSASKICSCPVLVSTVKIFLPSAEKRICNPPGNVNNSFPVSASKIRVTSLCVVTILFPSVEKPMRLNSLVILYNSFLDSASQIRAALISKSSVIIFFPSGEKHTNIPGNVYSSLPDSASKNREGAFSHIVIIFFPFGEKNMSGALAGSAYNSLPDTASQIRKVASPLFSVTILFPSGENCSA